MALAYTPSPPVQMLGSVNSEQGARFWVVWEPGNILEASLSSGGCARTTCFLDMTQLPSIIIQAAHQSSSMGSIPWPSMAEMARVSHHFTRFLIVSSRRWFICQIPLYLHCLQETNKLISQQLMGCSPHVSCMALWIPLNALGPAQNLSRPIIMAPAVIDFQREAGLGQIHMCGWVMLHT